ncbi:hypothetical protein EGW08_007001, partial [Elysia chlorotica]
KPAQSDGPTQKYNLAVEEAPEVAHREGKGEEAAEASGDDSDLEETSVLQMDQVAEGIVECAQVEAVADDKKMQGFPNSNATMISEESGLCDNGVANPPLSPEIPDRSNESTPLFTVPAVENDGSDTEEMVPDSMANSDGEDKPAAESGPIIPLPLPVQSPLKSALVDRQRSPSPARKRVNFTETEIPSREENVTVTNVDTRGGRESRTQKPLNKKVTRGRLTKNNHGESEYDASSKDTEENQALCDTKAKASKDQAKSKQATEEGSYKQSALSDGHDEKNVRKGVESNSTGTDRNSSPAPAQVEDSSGSEAKEVVKEVSSRSSRGRKRKKIENKTTNSASSTSIAEVNVDGKLREASIVPEEELKGEKEEEKSKTKTKSTKHQGKSKVAENDEESQDSAVSTPEGRTSSRGRRITTSNHLKDYDTGTKSRGRVSRASMQSSPVVNAKLPEASTSGKKTSNVKSETKESCPKSENKEKGPKSKTKESGRKSES